MSTKRNILNASFLAFVGQAGGLVLTFFTSVLIARGLGEAGFGEFTFLISFLTVVSLVPDFGLNWILQRELARSPEDGAGTTGTAFSIRLIFFLGVTVAANIVLRLWGYDPSFMLLASIMLLNIVFSSKVSGLRLVLESPYRAEMRLLIPTVLTFLDSVFLLAVLWFIPSIEQSLESVVVWYTAANIPGFAVLLIWAHRERRIVFRAEIGKAKHLLKQAAPLALYVALASLHNAVDIFLLKWFRGSDEVGQYGAAMRLFLPFIFIPNALVIGTFPVLSKWFADGSGRIKEAYQLGMRLLLAVSVCSAFVMALLAEDIIPLLFHDKFSNSVFLLQILSVGQIFLFLNVFGLSYITASDKQKWNVYVALAILGVDILFNALTIPTYGNKAAAISRVVAEMAGTAVLFTLTAGDFQKRFWTSFSKLIVGALGSLVIVSLMGVGYPILTLGVVLSAFVVWCILTNVISRDELNVLKSIVRPHSIAPPTA